MAKMRNNADDDELSAAARGGIRKRIESRVDQSGRLVLGFVLFYSGWLLAAYAVDVFSDSHAVSMLAAVAFWFGIVFAVLTLALGIVLAALNAFSEMRRGS